ncbi:hypothetical protein BOQ62_07010 [Chryseobacterium sp. CH21]|uniref:hypothetical protein n=1 Tax=Chryseobacterium sp. CH21 TaxID=713556 RepID=UPI00100AA84A|nr:hypothetical protein [Chryseobacterium sp. CH21]RXM40272.1 hypothetical protein BOQ62_07010 [Chryseobacterium sp. CH21]
MNKLKLLFLIPLFYSEFSQAQRIDKEMISFQLLKEPVFSTDLSSRNYMITVKSPYNITKDDVVRLSKEDYQKRWITIIRMLKMPNTNTEKD